MRHTTEPKSPAAATSSAKINSALVLNDGLNTDNLEVSLALVLPETHVRWQRRGSDLSALPFGDRVFEWRLSRHDRDAGWRSRHSFAKARSCQSVQIGQ